MPRESASPCTAARIALRPAAAALLLAMIVSPALVFAQRGEDTEPPEVTLTRNGEEPSAASDAPPESESSEANDEEASEANDGSAEEVMDDLLRRRREPPPATEPQRPPRAEQVPESVGVPAPTVEVDPDVLGIAPGQPAPELRREGEFIVSRRGRLVRSSDGAHVLFVFEADARDAPETPMIMMPCRMLESMEEIVADRGSEMEFILSGEVFVYRKHNYLLPTMMKIAVDRGNVEG